MLATRTPPICQWRRFDQISRKNSTVNENVTRDSLNYEPEIADSQIIYLCQYHTELVVVMSHVVRNFLLHRVKNTPNKPDGLGVHERSDETWNQAQDMAR